MNTTLPIACPAFSATPSDPEKRQWLIATGVAGGVAALATAFPLVSSFEPSERAKAAGGPVAVDISDIPPGGTKVVEWRGKPVWVVRRTPAMLAALEGHDAQLVDPLSLRAASSRTSPRRPTSRSRPIVSRAERASSSAKTPRPEATATTATAAVQALDGSLFRRRCVRPARSAGARPARHQPPCRPRRCRNRRTAATGR